MQVSSNVITSRVHSATISADEIKAVALNFVSNQVGVDSSSIVSSQVSIGADGTIAVEIVEAVPAQSALPQAAPQPADAPVTTLHAPAKAPGFAA